MNKVRTIFIFLFFSSLLLLFAEEPLISAQDAAKSMAAELYWEPLTKEIIFSKNGITASCRIGSEFILYSDTSYDFASPPQIFKLLPCLPSSTIKKITAFFQKKGKHSVKPALEKTKPKSTGYKVGAVLIDPGHGGRDAGSVGSYVEKGKTVVVYEKDIALKVALDIYERMKKKYPDKKILMTRYGDTYPSLEDRVNKANSIKTAENEAVLYVSVHANASFNKKASGFEVWYLPPEYRRNVIDKSSVSKEIHPILNSMMEEEITIESILMAKNILDGLNTQIGKQSKNRGLKENEFVVVRKVKMPSVLIELGFITNNEEVKLLNSPGYLKKCALGIYNGLTEFITRFEASEGFTSK